MEGSPLLLTLRHYPQHVHLPGCSRRDVMRTQKGLFPESPASSARSWSRAFSGFQQTRHAHSLQIQRVNPPGIFFNFQLHRPEAPCQTNASHCDTAVLQPSQRQQKKRTRAQNPRAYTRTPGRFLQRLTQRDKGRYLFRNRGLDRFFSCHRDNVIGRQARTR